MRTYRCGSCGHDQFTLVHDQTGRTFDEMTGSGPVDAFAAALLSDVLAKCAKCDRGEDVVDVIIALGGRPPGSSRR